jgi:lipoate-protein ligase A
MNPEHADGTVLHFVRRSWLRRLYELHQNGTVIGSLQASWWSAAALAEADGHRWRIVPRGFGGRTSVVIDHSSGQVSARLSKDRTLRLSDGPTLIYHRRGMHQGWSFTTHDGREILRSQRTHGKTTDIIITPELSPRDNLIATFLACHLRLRDAESAVGAGGG